MEDVTKLCRLLHVHPDERFSIIRMKDGEILYPVAWVDEDSGRIFTADEENGEISGIELDDLYSLVNGESFASLNHQITSRDADLLNRTYVLRELGGNVKMAFPYEDHTEYVLLHEEDFPNLRVGDSFRLCEIFQLRKGAVLDD